MNFIRDIFSIQNELQFQKLALDIFHYQSENVAVYKEFISHLNIDPSKITNYQDIPFIPVELFKSREIIAAGKKPEIIFESSTTTGSVPARHFVADKGIYEESFLKGFKKFYGDPADICILALLPSYLERSGSSLVYMAEKLISASEHAESGFYLSDHDKLLSVLKELKKKGQKTLLLGVSFALIELAEKFDVDLDGIIIMETGGMKGRRKEMVREDLHNFLKERFHVKDIHSEYGMTELLSQAYSSGDGIYRCVPWMKVMIRDSYDPFQMVTDGNTGNINIIDLANFYSCSFIAASDMGRMRHDGSFEVLGRTDNSDIRGCNLMVE
ncbi:MAG: acyl transferase [Bacteroidales bacterium]|nr:acyl transferase [Bacteroidales bacterium]MCB9012694.1 acyl transferase [Bacteroidales bacterium]